MINAIVTGSGNTRRIHALPVCADRKATVDARIKIGNLLKNALWPEGRGFRAAKERGQKAMGRG